MSKGNLNASYTNGDSILSFQVELYTWIEEDVFYIYSPTLDLTGYGKTFKEAENSFEIMFNEFVDYTTKKDELFEELERLGWTVNKKKKRVHEPAFYELIQDNNIFKQLLTRSNINRTAKMYQIPV